MSSCTGIWAGCDARCVFMITKRGTSGWACLGRARRRIVRYAKRGVSLGHACTRLRFNQAETHPHTGEARVKRSARATPIGSLRPSIVLYDEPHPLGDEIGLLHAHDASRGPDLLLIMGTSLKVSGLKALVKDFAKAAHANKKRGLVVFVNATRPGKEWEGVIDVHVQGETDVWAEKVEEVWRRVRPGDWEVQTVLDMAGVRGGLEGEAEGVGRGKGKGEYGDADHSERFDLGRVLAGSMLIP